MLTILDIALELDPSASTMGDFDELGLPFFSGCQDCRASLGPAQAIPTTTGMIGCKNCTPPEWTFLDAESFWDAELRG